MKPTSRLAGVSVGEGQPVRFMGVINVSPESFYQGSVHKTASTLRQAAKRLAQEGADFLDIGAMSTAPYLTTHISEKEEISRLVSAIRVVRQQTDIPISVDTCRSTVAEAALKAGAQIINDISGLSADENMVNVAQKSKGLILMAHPRWGEGKKLSHPLQDIKKILKKIVRKAVAAGLSSKKIVLDPGIGFFRDTTLPWWKWDLSILRHFSELTSLPCPLVGAVSRKSFIGHILGEKDPHQRLAGSLAATVIAVNNGATLIRTHDVAETRKALLVAQRIKNPL